MRVNSKSVRGTAKGVHVVVDTTCTGGGDSACVDASVHIGSLGGSAMAGVGRSRVLNAMSFLDIQKIPPLTRPADFASHTCLASLNDVSVGFGTAGTGGIAVDFPSGGGGVKGVWETQQELQEAKQEWDR